MQSPRKYRTYPSTYFNATTRDCDFKKKHLKKRRKKKHCFKYIHLNQKLLQNPKLFLARLHLSTYFINAGISKKKLKKKGIALV